MKNEEKNTLNKGMRKTRVNFTMSEDTHEAIRDFKTDFGVASMSAIIEDLIMDFIINVREDTLKKDGDIEGENNMNEAIDKIEKGELKEVVFELEDKKV